MNNCLISEAIGNIAGSAYEECPKECPKEELRETN